MKRTIEPMDFLVDDALVYFDELVSYLNEKEALENIDRYMLSMCANSLFIMNTLGKEMKEIVEEGGKLNGWKQWSIYQMAEKNFKDYSAKLGLDPASRGKITAFLNKGEPKKVDSKSPMQLVKSL